MIYIRHSPYRNHHSDMHTPTVLPQGPNNADYGSPVGDKLERSPRRPGIRERRLCIQQNPLEHHPRWSHETFYVAIFRSPNTNSILKSKTVPRTTVAPKAYASLSIRNRPVCSGGPSTRDYAVYIPLLGIPKESAG